MISIKAKCLALLPLPVTGQRGDPGSVCLNNSMGSYWAVSVCCRQSSSLSTDAESKDQLLSTFSPFTAWSPLCIYLFSPSQCRSLYPLWARPVPSPPVLPCLFLPPSLLSSLPLFLSQFILFTMCFILALQANGHSFLHMEHETAVSLLKNFPKTVDLVILRESTI